MYILYFNVYLRCLSILLLCNDNNNNNNNNNNRNNNINNLIKSLSVVLAHITQTYSIHKQKFAININYIKFEW